MYLWRVHTVLEYNSVFGNEGTIFPDSKAGAKSCASGFVLLVAADRDEGLVMSTAVCVGETVSILSGTS